ncbi:MAG: hydantoinase/oxoprolinase family protein [Alphaproteobacteria bacterium]|nr:hydantoinase/oxoprolinase family protein [Alphaproteobacteria bacterium]
MSARYALSLDVGGTFTDAILADRAGRALHVAKSPSVPSVPAEGFFGGVDRMLERSGVQPAEVAAVLHGSTIVTNAILEGKGARTGLVTTKGFRHVLEIGRAEIPRAANLFSWIKPKRPVQARHIFEVPGRVRLDGTEAAPLDEGAVEAAAEAIRAARLDALAVVLLHSYANPAHERRVGEILRSSLPDVEIALSVDVLPVFREYERSVATTLNASVQPVVRRYIGRLSEGLGRRSVAAPLLLMKSNGGACPPDEAARGAVHLALSGPAAGAQGAAWLGRAAGIDELLTIDMGGTSADVALIRNGQPALSTAGRIGGHPLAFPMIDIHTIGAGGGSIATVTDQGAIRVGPESAGADPGPACYGKGGRRPTVSDANLVLGRIPPALLDGEVALAPEAAETAICEHVAEPLGMDLIAAARGIVDLVNANMTGALKVMSVERGLDPRDFALAAFGGAGPVHGADLMRELNAASLLVPRFPGILCAIGLLTTDLRYDFAVTRLQRAGAFDAAATEAVFAELTDEADRCLEANGVPPGRRRFRRSADMRYEKQGVELTVPCSGPVTENGLAALVAGFHALHERLYTFCEPEGPVEIVNQRVEATGLTDKFALPELPAAPSERPEPSGERLACLHGDALRPAPTYRRETLLADHRIEGPAIVDQLDSTTVLLPGQTALADRYGNLAISEGGP